MPKKSGLMNEREAEICKRFRIAREHTSRTQAQAAQLLGVTRSVIGSIESGQTPLRYFLADLACRKLGPEKIGLCQRWLALGLPPTVGYIEVPEEIELNLKPKALFSQAYRDVVGHGIERAVREGMEAVRGLDVKMSKAIGDDSRFHGFLQFLISTVGSRIPPERVEDYVKFVMASTSEFVQKYCYQPGHSSIRDRQKKRES